MIVAQAVVVKFMVTHSRPFLIYLTRARTLDILFTFQIFISPNDSF